MLFGEETAGTLGVGRPGFKCSTQGPRKTEPEVGKEGKNDEAGRERFGKRREMLAGRVGSSRSTDQFVGRCERRRSSPANRQAILPGAPPLHDVPLQHLSAGWWKDIVNSEARKYQKLSCRYSDCSTAHLKNNLVACLLQPIHAFRPACARKPRRGQEHILRWK
jgi:hypothetical protein